MQTAFLEPSFSPSLPQISVSLSLLQHCVFLFCHCVFWGSNLLRPAVSSMHVLEDMAFDASPSWSIGLIPFKVCCPWRNGGLHLWVTECFPLDMHVQDIRTLIHFYTRRLYRLWAVNQLYIYLCRHPTRYHLLKSN